MNNSSKMEGIPVLITDFNEGICFTLLDFLIEKNTLPFVLVKDFETIHEVYVNFSTAIPIVLDAQQCNDSVVDHLTVLPTMSCIFNFEGEAFEELHRETFDHFTRSINIFKDEFDICQVNQDILEAISDGYTLIVNLHNFPLPTATNHVDLLSKIESVEEEQSASSCPSQNPHLKYVVEKVLRRPSSQPQNKCPAQVKNSSGKCPNQPNRGVNPISLILKKIFLRFNPCSGAPVFGFLNGGRGRKSKGIKTPEQINKYIRTQQSFEIRAAFETIHESAIRNWIKTCKERFRFNENYEKQFERLCAEIKKKGEEGRKVLLDEVYKDIERTKEWDHVLGEKTVSRLKQSREKEVDLKVQHFCKRKTAEAREKIEEDIQNCKRRTKEVFYTEILDEQVMELMRINEKFQKQTELLMLPYTGELKVIT